MPHALAWRDSSISLATCSSAFDGNAAAIDADAAGIGFRIDERDAEPEIGGEKRGGVAAGPAADDDELNRSHRRSGRSGLVGQVVFVVLTVC